LVLHRRVAAKNGLGERLLREYAERNGDAFIKGWLTLELHRGRPAAKVVEVPVEGSSLVEEVRVEEEWNPEPLPEELQVLLGMSNGSGEEFGGSSSSGAADSEGERRLSEGAKVTIAEESGQQALSGDAIPASNGDAAALSSDAVPNGTAVEPAKPDAEEVPDDSRHSVWYQGYRRRWTSWSDHIDSIAHVLGVKFEEAEQLVRSRQPLVENVSLSDANKQANRLRQREIVVSVKPCSQG